MCFNISGSKIWCSTKSIAANCFQSLLFSEIQNIFGLGNSVKHNDLKSFLALSAEYLGNVSYYHCLIHSLNKIKNGALRLHKKHNCDFMVP